MRIFGFVVLFFSAINLFSQEYSITGRIVDSVKKEELIGTNILIINQSNQNKYGTNTDKNGEFILKNIPPDRYLLRVSFVGYKTFERKIIIRDRDLNFKNIILSPDSIMLKEVTTEASLPLIEHKDDTIQYYASSFKVRDDATSEDLVKKMPGITVDRSGKVEAMGEEVKKVLIDKKPFFGENAKNALNMLPAKHVKKVQVYDEPSDQSKFTGVNDGQTTKVMNLETKFEGGIKDAMYNKFSVGYGTENKYLLSGHYTKISDEERISFYGLTNNINDNGYITDWASMASVFGYKSARNMDTRIYSLGANYSNAFSGPLQYGIEYGLSAGNSDFTNELQRDYFQAGDIKQYYTESRNTGNKQMNHKINARYKINIDTFMNISLNANISFGNKDNNSLLNSDNYLNNEILTNILNKSSSENKIRNFGGSLLINRILSYSGNNLSFGLNAGYAKNEETKDWDSKNIFFGNLPRENIILQNLSSDIKRNNISLNLLYTHPFNMKSSMQLGYYITYNNNNDNKESYYDNPSGRAFDTTGSDKYENRYLAHKMGGKYSYISAQIKFFAGIYYNIDKYNKDQNLPLILNENRNYKNILPEFSLAYTQKGGTKFDISYSSRTIIPSLERLSGSVDKSNILQLTAGNRSLKESYSHSISVSGIYSSGDFTKSFWLRLNANINQDYIGNKTIFAKNDTTVLDGISLSRGARLTYPDNLDNQTGVNFSFRLINRISSFITNNTWLFFNYLKTPVSINNITDFSHSRSFGVTVMLGISSALEWNFDVYNGYKFTNSANASTLANKYSELNTIINASYRFPLDILVLTEFNYQYYSNLYNTGAPADILFNAYISKKFLEGKPLELKLSLFDILNKSNPNQKKVTDLYIEDFRSSALGRCIMLSLTYDLKEFSGRR